MYPTVRGWIYTDKQEDGNTYYQQFDKGIITKSELENIAKNLALKHVKENRSEYRHVRGNHINTFDIGPNQSGHGGKERTMYNKAIVSFEHAGLISKASKQFNEGQSKEQAYHIVMK